MSPPEEAERGRGTDAGLAAADAPARLRELGERGGRVREVAGNGLVLTRSRVSNEG